MAAKGSVAVVGGGIVGLAVAARLLEQRPGAEVTVLEKGDDVGQQQTGHNSGVVHAGVYYAPGSLKASLCTEGRTLLKERCLDRGIAYDECGKVVVALDGGELSRLDDIAGRARANGVPGIEEIGPERLAELEPHAAGIRAIWSPATAIVDFPAVCRSLRDDVVAAGGQVRLGAEVTGFEQRADAVRVAASGERVEVETVVICGGLHGDRLARRAGGSPDPRIVPFRGEYWKLVPERRSLVRGLLYPVPDPRYPFLGIHLTKRVDGEVLVGPNAILALAREGYRWRDVDPRALAETLTYPGFLALARKHWRTGALEAYRSLVKRAFVREAQRYVPDLRPVDVVRAPSGVRAQALGRDGTLVDDFVIERLGRVVAVRNAPSPAATSSLAIARHVAGLLDG